MRVAIFISLFGIVLGGSDSLAGSEKTEAEKLFRQMEAQLGEAKTIQCNFQMVLQACPGGIAKGSLILADGNKSRTEMENAGERQKADRVVTVCDGKKMAIIEAGATVQAHDVPQWQNKALKAGFARVGITTTRLAPLADEGKDFKADEAFAVTDFKLGENGRIGLREARLIQYTLVTKGLDVRTGKTRFAVSLWLDVETSLPLKRVVVPLEGDLEFTLTETYRGLTLDGKIDSKQFELPKEPSR